MLPTAATALSAAQLAQMFENGAHFLMTSIQAGRRARPYISPRPPLPEGAFTNRTLAPQPDREKYCGGKLFEFQTVRCVDTIYTGVVHDQPGSTFTITSAMLTYSRIPSHCGLLFGGKMIEPRTRPKSGVALFGDAG